ncbi:MAG TPA: translation initiation factor IF-2 [Candidatus Dormibacteraeota bacterium]
MKKTITLPVTLTVKELADKLEVKGTEVVKYLLANGVVATLNQSLDFDTAALAADHFGFDAVDAEAAVRATEGAGGNGAAAPAATGRRRSPLLEEADLAALQPRPPVVTVLGHVDHGKTSVLDFIRKTRVAAGEAGGITQRIGAYQIERDGRRITFIDTPGHAAFTAMRARGADVTDIAVLVVAADDGVMPQTEEAIQHARSAGVPIVVAVNKIDRDGADPNRVFGQLAERGLVPVPIGGDVEVVQTSALTGQGIDDLLETILAVADVEVQPTANPARPAVGAVIESQVERGRGPVATVLVQTGTLRVGDIVVAGTHHGRVRALLDDTGARVKEAGPSTPVQVTGLNEVVDAGDVLMAVDTERAARAIADERANRAAAQRAAPLRRITLADLAMQVSEGTVKHLNLVVKAEANGSLEALRGQLQQIDDPTVRVKIVGDGVGPISESDVDLAAVTDAIVIGFNVRPDPAARESAERQGVDVRFYDVVYQVTDDISNAIKGLYEPTFVEVYQGRAEVRKVFTVDGRNAIAGSHVLDGKVTRGAIVKVMRGGDVVVTSKIDRLRRFKDDVREVTQGFDCGITLEDFTDFVEGDLLEAHVVEQQNL